LKKPYPEIVDAELQFIDQIINSLIAPDGYCAVHRDIQPYQLFRMELLKIIKYPEISFRKFCSDDYFGKERKQNRRFVRLPLNTKKQADHTELCNFRRSLNFKQRRCFLPQDKNEMQYSVFPEPIDRPIHCA